VDFFAFYLGVFTDQARDSTTGIENCLYAGTCSLSVCFSCDPATAQAEYDSVVGNYYVIYSPVLYDVDNNDPVGISASTGNFDRFPGVFFLGVPRIRGALQWRRSTCSSRGKKNHHDPCS